MDRRRFIESCSAGAAGLSVGTLPALAADARPRAWTRALLMDEQRRPIKAASLQPLVNYVLHYPFAATPVFLLDLGRAVAAQTLATQGKDNYTWPGGVGPRKSIVAFSAICAHHLVYPTKEVSFISFRKDRAKKGVQDGLIHCCADHSQYDPAQGAKVLSGPAPQPLAAVLLAHDPKADTLTAYATLGGEMFDAFFQKYAAKLSLEMGSRARDAVGDQTVVRELAGFCRNNVQC